MFIGMIRRSHNINLPGAGPSHRNTEVRQEAIQDRVTRQSVPRVPPLSQEVAAALHSEFEKHKQRYKYMAEAVKESLAQKFSLTAKSVARYWSTWKNMQAESSSKYPVLKLYLYLIL